MIRLNLYDSCKAVIKKSDDNIKLPSVMNADVELIKEPESLSFEKNRSIDSFWVYYISDIHLEHQICKAFPNGATDTQVKSFVGKLVSDLLQDDIALQYHDHIIMFGGDTAASFELSKLFYSSFIQTWDKKNKEDHRQKKAAILAQKREEKRIKQEISVWKSQHKWTKTAARDLLEYSDKRVPIAIKELIRRERELSQATHDMGICNESFYRHRWRVPEKRVFAVLGNHELWDFDTLESCSDAYQKLFSDLGITFLNNSGCYIRKKDERIWRYSVAVIGGIGFAGYNDWFNADCGLYNGIINREQEIGLTKEWEAYYQKAIKKAHEEKGFLIVLTHNQPSNWSKQNRLDSNCVYFYGHDHRNTSYYIEETNTFVFADNQIGYDASDVAFKKVNIFTRSNPFAGFSDGVFIISPEEYRLFNQYNCIYLNGTKRIENYVNNGSKLYMVKEKGYYGFFVVCEKKAKGLSIGTFICVGGRLRKVNHTADIEYYKNKFSDMVNTYLTIMTPYRSAQERIAKAVRSFGGEGTIHGFIVDIDFYNHIMLNPADGKITFYYSPFYGLVQEYGTVYELLSARNPALLERSLEQAKLIEGSDDSLVFTKEVPKSRYVQVDIKNSPYTGSMKMNQLQRLFDAKVLRDWDDSLPTVSNGALSVKNT